MPRTLSRAKLYHDALSTKGATPTAHHKPTYKNKIPHVKLTTKVTTTDAGMAPDTTTITRHAQKHTCTNLRLRLTHILPGPTPPKSSKRVHFADPPSDSTSTSTSTSTSCSHTLKNARAIDPSWKGRLQRWYDGLAIKNEHVARREAQELRKSLVREWREWEEEEEERRAFVRRWIAEGKGVEALLGCGVGTGTGYARYGGV